MHHWELSRLNIKEFAGQCRLKNLLVSYLDVVLGWSQHQLCLKHTRHMHVKLETAPNWDVRLINIAIICLPVPWLKRADRLCCCGCIIPNQLSFICESDDLKWNLTILESLRSLMYRLQASICAHNSHVSKCITRSLSWNRSSRECQTLLNLQRI